MLSKQQKTEAIGNIKDNIQRSNAMFLTNVIGISSNDAVALRKKIREANGNLIVAKNTLFRKASEGTEAEELFKNLKGPHAVAFSFSDAPSVAKGVYEASKDHEVIELKGGIFDGKNLSVKELETLAKLPSRDEMLGTLLATFMAPISAFARVMEAIRAKKEEN